MKTNSHWALSAMLLLVVAIAGAVSMGSPRAQGTKVTGPAPAGLAKATFAGGCFW